MHFLSLHNDKLSLLQSAATDIARVKDKPEPNDNENAEDSGMPDMSHPIVRAFSRVCEFHQRGEAVPDAPPEDDRIATGNRIELVWMCAKLYAEYFLARLEGDDAKAMSLREELRYNVCDPDWLSVVERYLNYFGSDGKKAAIPYVRHRSLDDFVMPILAPDARIAIISDWGTGTREAVNLLREVKTRQPDVLIHLGDIYYAGTGDECNKKFRAVVDRVFERGDRPIPVYTLSGNHDMYSGGTGYYDMIKALNADPAHRQEASYFALRTVDGAWQFQAMDTGLNDHDPFAVADSQTFLEPAEVEWHLHQMRQARARNGRVVLLSHHQLFSRFCTIGRIDQKPPAMHIVNSNLLETYRRLAHEGDVAAWYWGHEHLLGLYDSYLGLDKGRCVGCGAVPVFREAQPYAVVEGVPEFPGLVDGADGQPVMLGEDGALYRHGYAIIELEGSTATARYYEEGRDCPLYEEQL